MAHGEVLLIDAVRADGWVLARNPGDATPWLCNLSRALAVTPLGYEVVIPRQPRPEADEQTAER
jgi:hypothetical protein